MLDSWCFQAKLDVKRTVHAQNKNTNPSPVVLFIHLYCCDVSCWVLGISAVDTSGTRRHSACGAHNAKKTEQSWLGKIIHTPCCEHVGAIFYILNYTHHTCHSAEGKSASTHGDINERWRWRAQLEVMQLLGGPSLHITTQVSWPKEVMITVSLR